MGGWCSTGCERGREVATQVGGNDTGTQTDPPEGVGEEWIPPPPLEPPPRGLLMRHLPAAGAAIILRSLIGVDEDQQHACMDDICIDRYK